MPKVITINTTKMKCKPNTFGVKKAGKTIQWVFDAPGWTFPSDATKVIEFNVGEEGTDPVSEFYNFKVDRTLTKFSLQSYNAKMDMFKYTLNLIDPQKQPQRIDPGICNTGDEEKILFDLQSVIVFVVGLAAGATGAHYFF